MNPEAKITGYKSMQEAAERALEIEQELAKDMKAGRKISNMRLKSLQDASKAMKKASSIIDAVIREVEGAKKVNPGKESKSISVREVEIYF